MNSSDKFSQSRAVCIATGDELLNGKVKDINTSFLLNNLRELGFKTEYTVVSGDNRKVLTGLIDNAAKENDLIIITGGLGPTDDDLTISSLQEIYGFNIVTEKYAAEKINNLFSKSGRKAGDTDYKMAEVPENALILRNDEGLAPGFILETENAFIIALPGPPAECSRVFTEQAIPIIRKKFKNSALNSLNLVFCGIRESVINTEINSITSGMENLKWGITSSRGTATVNIQSPNLDTVQSDILLKKARAVFGDNLLIQGCSSAWEELFLYLKNNSLTIATAESCTGGLIGSKITDIPGASTVYAGGAIVYSNQMKINMLKVRESTINKFGAVSTETADEMASGIAEVTGADCSIAVTGIAGPEGGSSKKPVGTVCFSFITPYKSWNLTEHSPGTRTRVRELTALRSIDEIRRNLKKYCTINEILKG